MKRYTGYPKIEVPEKWNGCRLVNPLCPDDLCWLPLTSRGYQHHLHCLSTDPWDERFTTAGTALYMSKISTTREDLVTEGWQRQLKLFPNEAAFRREVWGADYVDWLEKWTPGSPAFTRGPQKRKRRAHWRQTKTGAVWVRANGA